MLKSTPHRSPQATRPIRSRTSWLGILLPAALLLPAGLAHAEDFEAPPINDENPAASLPSPEDRMRSPLLFGYVLMTLTERGEQALKEGDGSRAARYFEAVTQAVPEKAIGFSKLCQSRSRSGDSRGALAACHEALFKEGVTLADYARYLQARGRHQAPWTQSDWQELDEAMAHYRKSTAPSKQIDALACELSLHDPSGQRLNQCVTDLHAADSRDAELLLLAWANSARSGRDAEAARLLGEARAAGLTEEQYQQVERLGPAPSVAMKRTNTRRFGIALLSFGGLILAAFGIGKLMKLGRSAQSPVMPPAQAP